MSGLTGRHRSSNSSASENEDSSDEAFVARLATIKSGVMPNNGDGITEIQTSSQNAPSSHISNQNVVDRPIISENKIARVAGAQWSEVAQMRCLEDQLSGATSSLRAGAGERGAETYAYLPTAANDDENGVEPKKPPQKNVSRKRRLVSDDEIEPDNLWGSSSSINTRERRHEDGGPPKDRNWKPATKRRGHALPPNSKPQRHQPEVYVPRRLMRQGYERNHLFSTTLDPDNLELDDVELAKQIADSMGEKIPEMIEKVVEMAGRRAAIELFERVKEIEAKGGLLVERGNRRRTPGGVYLHLFKTELKLSDEKRQEFNDFSTKFQEQLRIQKESEEKNRGNKQPNKPPKKRKNKHKNERKNEKRRQKREEELSNTKDDGVESIQEEQRAASSSKERSKEIMESSATDA